jgi:hypothetical protein
LQLLLLLLFSPPKKKNTLWWRMRETYSLKASFRGCVLVNSLLFVRKNARVSMKSNVSHILILERAFLVKPESSSRMKNEKRTTTTVGCVPSLVFFVRFSFSLFFRDVSTLMFLHFFNRNEEEFSSVSFPRYNDAIHPIHRRRRGAL